MRKLNKFGYEGPLTLEDFISAYGPMKRLFEGPRNYIVEGCDTTNAFTTVTELRNQSAILKMLIESLPKCSSESCENIATHLSPDDYGAEWPNCDHHGQFVDGSGRRRNYLPYADAIRNYNTFIK